MVAEWIKVRRGLRQLPKTVIVARKLEETDYLKNLVTALGGEETQAIQRQETIMSDLATRVTVSALFELWIALNDVVDKEFRVKKMKLRDIDIIVGLPGFGEAVAEVEWVHEEPKGLFFRNFGDWNTPDSMRTPAQTGAQRAKKYRDKNREELRHKRHETSRLEEKSREEKRRGDLHPQHWDAFLLAWQNGKGRPYDLKNPPPVWSSVPRDAIWLEQAKKAVAHLPNCKYFKTPVNMTQFLISGWIEKILGGGFDDPRCQGQGLDHPSPLREFSARDKEAVSYTRKKYESDRKKRK
jgi:hypothetical protein